MAFSRHLGIVSILSVSWLVAVGCSDDDKNVAQGEGGEAGDGGETSGGKSTSGGSANNAGKSGNATAGKGGTGSGGADTGGAAGSGAGAGAVGGEDAGGAGGAPGPGPGGAGAGGASAGAGGAGGAPDVPVAKKCDFGCNVDADCNGIDSVGHCDQTLKRCRSTDCTVSADCVVGASFWITPCANDSECTPDLERCVAWQGIGYCAGVPDPQTPEFPCLFGGFPTTMPLFGAVGEAEVCADLTQVCNKGACEPGCGSFGCGAGTGDTCNPATGLCECAQSSECTKAGVSVCGGNGLCGCADDTDCAKTAGTTGLGKCVNGTCGCDSAASCLNTGYPNSTKVCE